MKFSNSYLLKDFTEDDFQDDNNTFSYYKSSLRWFIITEFD